MACSKYELGYDDNRFEIEVSESFQCVICFLVLKDPVMCKNQHYFCSFCIKKHLENSAFCPTCLEHLTVDTLIQVPRIVTDYLSELNIHCDYHPRGCCEVLKLKNLKRHVASCGFSPVQCSNDGCNALVNLRDKLHHQSEVCEFRKSKCHDCSQLKQEVKELRVQVLAQQDQIKTEMKGMKDQVMNEIKQEMKGIKDQLLSRQDQSKMQGEIFARQDQMKEEMKQDVKARQEATIVEIKQDLKGMKNEILSEVREVVKMAVENMVKEMKAASEEVKKEMKEIIKDQMKPTSSNQPAGSHGRQEETMKAEEYTIAAQFAAQVALNEKQPMSEELPEKPKQAQQSIHDKVLLKPKPPKHSIVEKVSPSFDQPKHSMVEKVPSSFDQPKHSMEVRVIQILKRNRHGHSIKTNK